MGTNNCNEYGDDDHYDDDNDDYDNDYWFLQRADLDDHDNDDIVVQDAFCWLDNVQNHHYGSDDDDNNDDDSYCTMEQKILWSEYFSLMLGNVIMNKKVLEFQKEVHTDVTHCQ